MFIYVCIMYMYVYILCGWGKPHSLTAIEINSYSKMSDENDYLHFSTASGCLCLNSVPVLFSTVGKIWSGHNVVLY
jgi:hypothetical protein